MPFHVGDVVVLPSDASIKMTVAQLGTHSILVFWFNQDLKLRAGWVPHGVLRAVPPKAKR